MSATSASAAVSVSVSVSASACAASSTSSSSLPVVLVDRRPPLMLVGINRLHARNAVNGETARALLKIFNEFDADDACAVAVLYGVDNYFCAGADLKGVAAGTHLGAEEALKRGNPMEFVTEPINQSIGPMGPSRMLCSKPVIAAVEGYAVAGGFELACWCDLRVASRTAVMGVFCRRWGVPLLDGGTVRLPALIGMSRAMDLILTGRPVAALEAFQMGLVNRVVEPGKALEEAEKLALSLCQFPQLCLRRDRRSAYYSVFEAKSLTDALTFEFVNGLDALKQEGFKGAKRFADGTGRGGSFAAFAVDSHKTNANANASSASDPAASPHGNNGIRGVFFDLGGVIVASPIHVIMEYETRLGISQHGLNRLLGSSPHFHALEEGRLTLQQFTSKFQAECDSAGGAFAKVDVAQMFKDMGTAASQPRGAMMYAIRVLRQNGLIVCAITNDWKDEEDGDTDGKTAAVLRSHFDHIFQSSRLGIRKPNDSIYLHALQRTQLQAHEVIFVDDIAKNLLSAKKLGMKTVKVNRKYEDSLVEIAKILGYKEDALLPPQDKQSNNNLRAAL